MVNCPFCKSNLQLFCKTNTHKALLFECSKCSCVIEWIPKNNQEIIKNNLEEWL